MTISRTSLARQALEAAQRVRIQTRRPILTPLCIYDVVAEMNVDLWFQQNSSLEGMYAQTPTPHIIVGSERPAHRRRFTCAHELGHHVFQHGTRVDDFQEGRRSTHLQPDEFIAQAFAGFLLMPQLAVANAFRQRGWNVSNANAEQVYCIATVFGVGFETLVHHMWASLKLISDNHKDSFQGTKLRDIRSKLIEDDDGKLPILIADQYWTGRPIDAEVGDRILAPHNCVLEGANLNFIRHTRGGSLWEAVLPGQSRLVGGHTSWAAFVRVSRKNYQGRGIFRHLPDVPDYE